MELLRALAPHTSREEWFFGLIALSIAIALMLATRVAARQRVSFRAAGLFLALSAGAFFGRQLTMASAEAGSFFAAIAILFYALAMARIVFLFAFDGVLMRNRADPTPRILRDIAQGALFFVALILALRGAGVEAGQLLTTSALFTVVAGMALQETLGNLVAGLAMQGERPFEVGDWIEIHGTPGHIGKVREINWRATRLHTLDNVDVVVPNGLLAKAVVTNYDRPHRAARRSIYFQTTIEVPPRRVHEIVLAAIADSPGVLSDPAPSIVTFGFVDSGAQFWLRYFINEMQRRDGIDGGVRDRIWYSLERNGIPFGFPNRNISLHEVSEQSERARLEKQVQARLTALKGIDLFSPLDETALRRLAEESRTARYAAGETVIRRGEAGDTMFVVSSGQLSVRLTDQETARLGEGAFFGEMSLLTGSPRGATVVALDSCALLVIDHDAFHRILADHPEVAKQIGEKVVERRSANQITAEAPAKVERRIEQESDDLVARIRSFFGLRRLSD